MYHISFHHYPPQPSPCHPVRRSAQLAYGRAANAERINTTEQVAVSHSFIDTAEKAYS